MPYIEYMFQMTKPLIRQFKICAIEANGIGGLMGMKHIVHTLLTMLCRQVVHLGSSAELFCLGI